MSIGATPRSSYGSILATFKEISAFLAEVERRAFKQAMFALRDEHSALDIVQDAMLKLTEKYSDKPAGELPMLFQRILQNTIHDHFRRQKVRTTWTTVLSALGRGDEKDDEFDPLETLRARSDSNANADPAEQFEQARDHATQSSRRWRGCRRVNGKRFCYVTGKSSMWRRRPPRWVAPRAASRRTARAPCMPWPRCSDGQRGEIMTDSDEDFAKKITTYLDRGAAGLKAGTAYRLQLAREAALARAGGPEAGPGGGASRGPMRWPVPARSAAGAVLGEQQALARHRPHRRRQPRPTSSGRPGSSSSTSRRPTRRSSPRTCRSTPTWTADSRLG